MSITYDTSYSYGTIGGSSGTTITSFINAPTSGERLFAAVTGDASVSSITGPSGATWTKAVSNTSGSENVSLWFSNNVTTGGSDWVVTFASTITGATVGLFAYAGIVANDLTGSAQGTATTAPSGSFTPTNANSLLINVCQTPFDHTTPSNSWVALSGDSSQHVCYHIQAGGPSADSTTLTLSGSEAYCSVTAIFSPTSIAAGVKAAPPIVAPSRAAHRAASW